MKGNSGRKLMAMILFLVLPAVLLATVSVRSATADAVLSTVAVGSDGSDPVAVAVNPATNKIYVITVNNGNVTYTATVIDGATSSTSTVSVGADPSAVAVNPVTNKIYVVNTNGYFTNSDNDINNGGHTGSVTVIDGADNSTATVDAGILPCAIAVNPVTNKIYVANEGDNTVTVIDGATNGTATVSVGTSPDAVAVNPVTNKIYVANSSGGNNGNGTVTVIDGADNSTATVNAGSYPLAIAVNSATNKVYVVNNSNAYGEFATGTVTVIDGATNQTATVTVGLNPIALTVNPDTNKVYIVNNHTGSDSVTVIDGVTNSTDTVSVGPDPGAIAVNPATGKVYVVNLGAGPCQTSPNWDGTVTVIDGTDNSTTTVPVGLHPDAVAVNAATGQVYVANEGDDTVTVLNGASASEVQKSISFTVGQNSYTANGQSLAMDAVPLIAGGRLLAPVRSLADALDATTTWDAHRRAVSIIRGNTALELAIGSATLNDNGRVGWMGTAPVIINGRIYFPLRYVAEALGCKVDWDQASQTATVTYSASIPDLPLVNNGNGPGPLTQENTSLGGIHLGDHQSKVLALYGAPTSKGFAHGTPFPLWSYQQDDMYVDFYANGGPVAPDPLVEDVHLDENSSLHTDRGIGIGSTLEEILDSYGPVSSTAIDPDTQIRNIWFYGSNKETLGQQTLYYPTLDFVLKNDRVAWIYLSDEENEPQ